MIFVSGLSRSGTTLVQGLVTNSPQTIGMTAECSYFRSLLDSYRQSKHPGFFKHLEDYFQDFEQFYIFHQNIVQKYVNHVRDLHPTGYQVHKEPRLLRVWPELHDFWPQAFYIIVYRDPRDILASQYKRAQWDDFGMQASQWLSEQMMNLQIAMSGPQENIWVRYEDLVTEPEKTLGILEEQLGIEIPLDKWEVKRQDDSVSPLDGKLPEPSSIGKWKEVLSKEVSDNLLEYRDWFEEISGHDWFYTPS